MTDSMVARILACYGRTPAHIYPSQRGYRNESYPVQLVSGDMVNLILYKRESDILTTIRHAHAVGGYLHAQGLPVRAPIDNRILSLKSQHDMRYVGLYNYLPGETISWEAYTQKHMKLLGKTLSDLHANLKDFPAANLPQVHDVYSSILARMLRYFSDIQVQDALASKLGLKMPLLQLRHAESILRFCRTLPDQQALHMDFVRSNVLFMPGSNEFGINISGILDFEKVAYGSPIFDISRTLAFLIVDCKYKPEAKVRKYFLRSGYIKRGASSLSGQNHLMEELLNVFLLHDLYKFLRHNPYESLGANEHFVRTRELLLERGVISTTFTV